MYLSNQLIKCGKTYESLFFMYEWNDVNKQLLSYFILTWIYQNIWEGFVWWATWKIYMKKVLTVDERKGVILGRPAPAQPQWRTVLVDKNLKSTAVFIALLDNTIFQQLPMEWWDSSVKKLYKSLYFFFEKVLRIITMTKKCIILRRNL